MKVENHRPVVEVAEDTLLEVGATNAKKLGKRLAHETAIVEEDIAAQPWPSWHRSVSQYREDSDLQDKVGRPTTSSRHLPFPKSPSGVLLSHEVVLPSSSTYPSTSSSFAFETSSSQVPKPVPGFSSEMVELATIGSGGEGDCMLYKHRFTSKLFVCKALVHKRWIPTRNGVPEIVLVHDILGSYDRVLALLAWERHPVTGTLRLWHPYHDRGDLYDLLNAYCSKHKIHLPEAFIWHVFIQLAEALAYIHDGYNRHDPHPLSQPLGFRSIIHRDIKPENVLLQSPNGTPGAYPSIILADFGLAITRSTSNNHVGTTAFQGPELPHCSRAGDLWSLGAVMHWLCSSTPPLKPKPTFDYKSGRALHRMRTQEWEKTPRARLTGKEVLVRREGYSRELEEALGLVLRWKKDARVGGKELIERLRAGEKRWMESGGRFVELKEWTTKGEKKANLKREGHQTQRLEAL
ncbi:MAG: hypothetical protein LQ351_006370 [Letrouitia transgressa]|nr:MAG: hypothetical protein LQ351_006370 [Letrouitia transgressa]